jgi:type VI protein secretion system component Hcp
VALSAAHVRTVAYVPSASPAALKLMVDGIAGRPNDNTYANQIDASSYSWGTAVAYSVGSAPQPAQGSLPNVSDLTVLIRQDKSLPLLETAANTGQPIRSVRLSALTTENLPYLTIELTNARVDSVQLSGSASDATVSVSFYYVRETTTSYVNGAPQSSSSWDRAKPST